MTTKKAIDLAIDLFVATLNRRFLATHGCLFAISKETALRTILRFPAGVLKTLAACSAPMTFNDTQVFRRLFRQDDYPAPNVPTPSWKDDREFQQRIESEHSTGELSDALYVEIKELLPISYADAVAIVKKANEEKCGASAEEIHDCLTSLESHGAGELPPQPDAGAESETERFLAEAEATLLRWRLVRGYDWAFVRGALLRLFRMARKEWRPRSDGR